MAHVIRPIRMSDADAVSALLDWAWFAPRSEAGWRWLCRTPRSRDARAMPVGFVAEDSDGQVGGVFGLFVQDYSSSRGEAVGGTGHSLIVHPRLKGASAGLIDAALDQAGLFGLTILNGNQRAVPIYARHGFQPCPAEGADATLIWITNPIAVLAERAVRARFDGHAPAQSRPAEKFMSDRLFTAGPARLGNRIVALGAADLDERVDSFWSALADEGRLTARRDQAALRWRMSDPDRTRDPILLAWMDDDRIAGLALAQLSKINQIQCPSLDVIDLVALEPFARQATPELVAALVRNASRLGAARVRIAVATPEMESLVASVPGMLKRRAHIHGHVRFNRDGADLARDWRLTPYDGEFGIGLRQPPRPLRQAEAA